VSWTGTACKLGLGTCWRFSGLKEVKIGATYLISLPFVSAFNFSEIFLIPLIVCLVAAVWYTIIGQIKSLPIVAADKLLALFLGSVLVSVVVNASTLGPKGVNHTIAMLGGPIFFYLIAERITKNLNIQQFLHYLYIGYLIAIWFGIIEFLLVNFAKFDLSSVIVRPSVSEYSPLFLSLGLTRARSTFTESGYFAAYISVLFPLMIHYIWTYRPTSIRKLSFLILSGAAMFAAFSVSLFIFLPAAIGFSVVSRSILSGRLNRSAVIIVAILLCASIVLLVSPQLHEEVFGRKFSGSSYSGRYELFAATLEIVDNSDLWNFLFGFGPGSYANFEVKAAISVYINFLRDIGLFGIIFYLVFLTYILIDVACQRHKISGALLVSVLVQALFFVSTPIYFQPHYYLIYIVYKKVILEERNKVKRAALDPSPTPPKALQPNA
jgi:hypothetical protein